MLQFVLCQIVGTVNGNSHYKEHAFKTIFFHFGGAYCVLFSAGIVKGDHGFEGSGPSCSK
jgi:hypothetical protein